MINKRYFLPISSINLNSVFASESISPHSFYEERKFGFPYNSETDNNGKSLQPKNCLALYHDIFQFQPSYGSPAFFVIYENDLDQNCLIEDSKAGVTYYFKTIYLRRGNFILCFPNENDRSLFLAMASPSVEVKTLGKYNIKYTFLDSKESDIFYNIESNRKLLDRYLIRRSFTLNESLSQRNFKYNIAFDKAFNHIKGFIYGFLCGSIGQKTDNEIELEKTFQELHNLLTIAKGSMYNDEVFESEKLLSLKNEVEKSQKLFKIVFPDIETFGYKNILVRISELLRLQELRYNELKRQKSNSTSFNLITVTSLKNDLNRIETALATLRGDEQDLKNRKKELTEESKLIKRPKQGTKEKLEKEKLLEQIESLKRAISLIGVEKKELKDKSQSIQRELQQYTTIGRTDFDSTVEDQYLKISGYISDIMFFVSQLLSERKTATELPSIDKIILDIGSLIEHIAFEKDTKINFIKELKSVQLNKLNELDIALYQIIINILLAKSKSDDENLSAKITDIVSEVESEFSNTIFPSFKEGQDVLSNLRLLLNNRSNKTTSYDFPSNKVLACFACFVFRPHSSEELISLMYSQNIIDFNIAYSFWATYNGFANLPKTFTNVILENDNDQLHEYIDSYLFENYIKKSYPLI